MTLRRPVLSTLLLLVAAPLVGALVHAGTAEAAIIIGNKTKKNADNKHYGITMANDDGAASVGVTLRSDAGDEELSMVETNAWLHGSATISAIPSSSDGLALTLYDADSAKLLSFSGRLGADGSVSLVADAPEDEGCVVVSRLGCEIEESSGEDPDIELLIVDVFQDGDFWELSLDLTGADAYAVAYAVVAQTPACTVYDTRGNCLVDASVTTEVGWDEIGSVWEAEASLDHYGVIDAKVKAYDAAGETVASESASLGKAWEDDGEGVNALGTDGDPLTTLALHPPRGNISGGEYATDLLTVVSEGWALGQALPTHAQVKLKHGETLTVPVNSYQRRLHYQETLDALADVEIVGANITFLVDTGTNPDSTHEVSVSVELRGVEDVGTPLCSNGICVVLTETDGSYGISITAYDDDANALPDDVRVTLSLVDADGIVLASEAAELAFDNELSAVFSSGVSFGEDPVGLDLAGTVSLLGAPNSRGRQSTLSRGNFYGTVTRDSDGELSLGGSSGGSGATSGGFVYGDASVGLTERGTPLAPPVILYGNGSGTKTAASQTSTRPQLL